jgi:hypothetical protein
MGVTINLSSPITAHGEEVTELTLQEPTGKHIREIGSIPFGIDSSGDIKLDAKSIAQYISKLCAIPMSSVDAINPGDFFEISWLIVGMFGQKK